MVDEKEKERIKVDPQPKSTDSHVSDEIRDPSSSHAATWDRLIFDGYKLRWRGASSDEYDAFSGQADLSARESEKDLGSIPQGLYTVNPKHIRPPLVSGDWGKSTVKIEPYRGTVDRMRSCFKDGIRRGFYIHGGDKKGTAGCIEINDNEQDRRFFSKLKAYGKKMDLEVKYHANLKKKLEEPKCPYK